MASSVVTPPAEYCNTRPRTGTLCRHQAGWRTWHPGVGRCGLHGGATPVRHGRYSQVLQGGLEALFGCWPPRRRVTPRGTTHRQHPE